MYPAAITHQAVAAIEQHRDRQAESGRQARTLPHGHGRLTRALIAIARAVPTASVAPWLVGRS